MKTNFLILCGAALLLGGCNLASLGAGSTAPERAASADLPEDFSGLLAQEYKNLAALEQDFRQDRGTAAHYAVKASTAAKGAAVWPDDPAVAGVAKTEQKDLADSYNMMLDALENMSGEENAALLALAQTRYDCWLQRAAAKLRPDEVSVCREMMHKALGMMAVPSDKGLTHILQYNDDTTIFGEGMLTTIEDAARHWSDRPLWEVMLVSHTAAKGNAENNKRQAIRRAVAIRNALAQQGVDPDNITIVVRKAGADEPYANGRRVDIRFEPVYVRKEEGPVYESLESLGYE